MYTHFYIDYPLDLTYCFHHEKKGIYIFGISGRLWHLCETHLLLYLMLQEMKGLLGLGLKCSSEHMAWVMGFFSRFNTPCFMTRV